jgi:hypothetical protein
MKGILKILGIVAVFTVSVFGAQAQSASGVPASLQQLKNQEYVSVKGGRLVLNRNGKDAVLTEKYVCDNGSLVASNCTVIRKDGTSTKLSEGDRIYKDGTIVSGLSGDEGISRGAAHGG